jgi:hypothetical protein
VSAAGVGRFLGWTLVAFGLWQFLSGGAGLWTMVIGWFIITSARAEAMRARFQIMSRNWAPPMWDQLRPAHTVIDVTGRPVAPPVDHPAEPQRVP